jgi:hypothetical protein
MIRMHRVQEHGLMMVVFSIAAILVLALAPSALYLATSKKRSPVVLSILAGVPLVLATCAAGFIYFQGSESRAEMLYLVRSCARMLRVPLLGVAVAAALYLVFSRRKRPVAQDLQKPPLSVKSIALEILAGSTLGIIALVGVYAVGIVSIDKGCYAVFSFFALFIGLFPPLYGIASAAGVYLVGNRGKQTGSVPLTVAGGFAGAVVAGGASFLWLMGVNIVLLALLLPVGPILATLGFNWTRRYRDEPPAPA